MLLNLTVCFNVYFRDKMTFHRRPSIKILCGELQTWMQSYLVHINNQYHYSPNFKKNSWTRPGIDIDVIVRNFYLMVPTFWDFLGFFWLGAQTPVGCTLDRFKSCILIFNVAQRTRRGSRWAGPTLVNINWVCFTRTHETGALELGVQPFPGKGATCSEGGTKTAGAARWAASV